MRPIANSSSCNTLIDLNHLEDQKALSADSSQIHDIEFSKTELLLPREELYEEDDYYDEQESCYEHADEGEQYLYLPSSAKGSAYVPVDVYLRGIPEIIENADTVLAQTPRVFNNRREQSPFQSSKERILNVCQGEMAHAVSAQCDVMLSDDATTCHIVALRSYTVLEDKQSTCSEPFTSLTHIDNPEYEQSIRDMFEAHENFHQQNLNDDDSTSIIYADLHIMGGFDDQDGTSREISEYLLSLFSRIAEELRHVFKITLQTCAITSINDDGTCAPIGRGFGIELSTGDVFLATVEKDMEGPGIPLRNARGWSVSDKSHEPSQLRLIHDYNETRTGRIIIEPFRFQPFTDMITLMNLPDDMMLHCISTSPDVEKDNFCEKVRTTLKFIRDEKWWNYFGNSCDKPVVFERDEIDFNKWNRI